MIAVEPWEVDAVEKVIENHVGIADAIHGRLVELQSGIRVSKDWNRVRSCVNILRSTERLAVCSDSSGYWVAFDGDELDDSIARFEHRVAAQNRAIAGMKAMRALFRSVIP